MNLLTILGLAVALSMDALAVAVAVGVKIGGVSRRQTFRLAFHFGLFQSLMPLLGWSAGMTVASVIQSFDHFAAFALLALVGGHMVWAGVRSREESEAALKDDPTRGLSLLALSVATSLDALAVGFSLSLINVSVWWPALLIGLVCAAITAAGLQAGRLLARLSWMRRAADL
ncbi:MAG: manganese efflux pump, partial [Acidobacteria bacterium]|nr:manganese efflux pump [Acidobacteriota bacterium]